MIEPSDQSGTRPRVLVVVPCLNEAAHLPGLLRQLLSNAGLEHARVVVADGGSTDASQSIVQAFAEQDSRIILLHNPGRFQSAGINLAVRRFGEGRDILVRIDAHAEYPADYVAGLLGVWSATGADSVVVPMYTRGARCFQRAAAAAQNSRLGNGGARHRGENGGGWVDHGHHALFDLTTFTAAGGYNEAFSHNEDAELDERLIRSGRRIWLAQDLMITYFPRSTPGALFAQYRSFGRGRAWNALAHGSRPKLRQLAPAAIAPAIVLALATPWFGPAAVPALVWTLLCLTGGLAIGLVQRSLCASASGLAAMIMHLAWSIGFWEGLTQKVPRQTSLQPMGRTSEPAPS